MDEAIELELEGHNPYPKRAMFLDSDEPGLEGGRSGRR
jgi:hypothetical protein